MQNHAWSCQMNELSWPKKLGSEMKHEILISLEGDTPHFFDVAIVKTGLISQLRSSPLYVSHMYSIVSAGYQQQQLCFQLS